MNDFETSYRITHYLNKLFDEDPSVYVHTSTMPLLVASN